MNDQLRPPIVDPLARGTNLDDVDGLGTADDARREEARRRGLPEHEIDDDESPGGGILAAGGTAVDRGLEPSEAEESADDKSAEDDRSPESGDRAVPEPVDPNRRPPLPPR